MSKYRKSWSQALYEVFNKEVDLEEIELSKEDAGSFCAAASKAKEAGKKTFKMGGKEYPVTIKVKIPEEVGIDELVAPGQKSHTGYELYHKDFSSAMQHAVAHAKKKGHTIDPKEIDDKVATGPKKPSKGKVNRYALKAGRKTVQIQVTNLDNKAYELNMYIEGVDLEESAGLQLKMAFDDAGIKVKGVKSGKLVIDKKDKKKVEKVIAKQMKKPADAKRVLGAMVVFEDVDWDRFKIDESWKKGTYTITDVKTGKVLGKFKSGAKAQKAADDIFQRGDYDAISVEVDEGVEMGEAKGTAYPATIDTLRMIVKDKQHQTVMFKSGKAIVDLFTASAMVQVYDALKKPDMKKHFEKMIGDKAGFMKTQAFAMKMIG